MTTNLIKELQWRGMVQDIISGTEEQLKKEITTAYIGFDPTADSLHIGSLVQIILLVHLQRAGHRPIALVGGATGMIGDPTGKSEERNLLSVEALKKNEAGIQKQLERFLDFDPKLPNSAEIVNNFDWFKNFSFLDFIRDAGKHITVNYMMAKESVKKRLESENGMSFTEFTYQLIQGYDFYWLHKSKNCKLQMGGSDQWGNIVTGTEFIRRKGGGEVFAFTTPLIRKSDGGKFGKTESGNVWLDAEKTSPYQFYQFWLNATDADAEQWIKIFTFMDEPTINSIIIEHKSNPSGRALQKSLARELTIFVHGQEEFDKAVATTEKLFANQNASIDLLTEEDLGAIDGIVKVGVPKEFYETSDVISLLAETAICSSKSEARKLIQNNGLSINRKKVGNIGQNTNENQLLHSKFLLVQKGKKNYYLIEVE